MVCSLVHFSFKDRGVGQIICISLVDSWTISELVSPFLVIDQSIKYMISYLGLYSYD